MEGIKLANLKPGEFFTRKPNECPKEKQVFIKRNYDRSSKKYECQRFSDMNDYLYLKGDTTVYVDFVF